MLRIAHQKKPKIFKIFKSFLFLQIVITCMISSAFAAQTGKISGKVVDSNNKPIIGAHIVIENEVFGTASDLDGEFYILAISPGSYTVIASAIGYTTSRIEGLIVAAGQTRELKVQLDDESIELKSVTISYKKRPIELNETSQKVRISGEDLRQMPVSRADHIVGFQAGAYEDGNGDLHMRGGRAGEVGYIVDGMKVEDPLNGNRAANIGREATQEVQLLSGTFSAEYGDVMSGVVNIITREGRDKFGGSFDYESPMINSSPYRESDWAGYKGDAVRDTLTGKSLYQPNDALNNLDPWISMLGRFSGTFHGPVPTINNTTFFFHGVHESDQSTASFGDKWTRRLTGKISNTNRFGKMVFSFGIRGKNKQGYSHKWKYVPENYHRTFEKNNRFSFAWSKSLSKSFLNEFNAGYYKRNYDKKIFEDWNDYVNSDYQKEEYASSQYFYDQDDWSDIWRESSTAALTISDKFTWQMNKRHQWRGGFEYRTQDIEMLDIRELEVGENGERLGLEDRYNQSPIEISGFIQDKIELDYLIVNAGLRLDYVDTNAQGWSNPEDPTEELEDVKSSVQLSPRIGLAQPINENTTLHFAYGHFFQFPDYVNLFMNSSDMDLDTLANRSFDAVGNPSLKPQKTVAYEVGVKSLLTDEWGFSATAFYKDITDLVGTRRVRIGTKYNYAAFVNIDYASVIGMEFGINKILSNFWSIQANYTYSVAKGNSSEPETGYWDAYEGIPLARQEYYMDFDRRHAANAMITLYTGSQNFPRLFGTSLLKNINSGLIVNYMSGLPYTPYTESGEDYAQRNSERMAYHMTVDLRVSKEIISEPYSMILYMSADNLLDRINPLSVDSRTGEPWETTILGNAITFDRSHNPGYVGTPREIRIGILFNF
jgi:outer membrane receptor protein involved in Fe transport